MGISKKNKKSDRMQQLDAVVDAYKAVLADLDGDRDNWRPRHLKKAEEVLQHRLYELDTMWRGWIEEEEAEQNG